MARRKKQSEEQSTENTENIHQESDDNFGLPEVEYEPLNRDASNVSVEREEESFAREEEPVEAAYVEPVEVVEEEEILEEDTTYVPNQTEYDEDEGSPVWPKVLIGVVLLLIAGVAVWYFGYERPKQLALEERQRQEQVDQAAADKRAADERLAEQKRQDDERRRADSLVNVQPKEGSVEALSGRTGRYYVVISSAIDDDLVMDYAKKLSQKGLACTIIPPFGKTKFSRLAVDAKDSYADAQATADELKGGDYGNDIWVVHY